MIAVIDTDSILWACCFGVKLLDQQGVPLKEDNKFVYRDKTEQEVRLAIDSIMTSIITNTKCTEYIAFIKGRDTIKNRLLVNPEYKANRTAPQPPHYKIAELHFINKWKTVSVNEMEVDDAVNITRLNLDNSFIVAIDNDLLALETRGGMQHYNWRKNEFVHVNFKEAAFKFWSDMICGQSGDNIKGLPKRGKVFAEKLLIGEDMLPKNPLNYPTIVLGAYLQDLGTDQGMKEFFKNYQSLKILESKEGFETPEPIQVQIENKEEELNFDF